MTYSKFMMATIAVIALSLGSDANAQTASWRLVYQKGGTYEYAYQTPQGWLYKVIDSRGISVTYIPDPKWVPPVAAPEMNPRFNGHLLRLSQSSSMPDGKPFLVNIANINFVETTSGPNPTLIHFRDGASSLAVKEPLSMIEGLLRPQ